MKKFATLLPNNWLDETPQTLASRRLGRLSAERERISEINWNIFQEKTLASLIPNILKTRLFFMFFTIILNGLKKFATLLPNNWLDGTPQTLASRRIGRLSAERERISNQLEHLLRKNSRLVSSRIFLRLDYSSCFFTISLMIEEICDTPAE
ncbi:hypothetical protein RCO48_24265 [Peribacillus frigoritolerans]|nr:hypothetical protein [Peribacillus frigoritolerans]